MNKQVEQIKAEIERWKKELRLSTSCEAKYRREMLDDISEFIDSLQENPVSEDLEETGRNYADNEEYGDDVYYAIKAAFKAGAKWQSKKEQDIIETAEDHAFLAGANWQKEQMMKDAVDAEVVYMIGEGTLFNPEVLPDNIKPGDKVKIIIIKEN